MRIGAYLLQIEGIPWARMKLHSEVLVVCFADKSFVLGGNVLKLLPSRVSGQKSNRSP